MSPVSGDLRDHGIDGRAAARRVAPGLHRHDMKAMVLQERRIDLTGVRICVGDQDDSRFGRFVRSASRASQRRAHLGRAKRLSEPSVAEIVTRTVSSHDWKLLNLMQNGRHGLAGCPGRRSPESGRIPRLSSANGSRH